MAVRIKKLCTKPSFLLLCAVVIFFFDFGTAAAIIFAIVMHELGHIAAILLCGGQIRKINLSGVGAEIVVGGAFSYGKEMLTAIAGPAASLVAAVLSAGLAKAAVMEELYVAAGVNLLYGAVNLLPLSPLDGGHIINSLMSFFFGPFFSAKASFYIDAIFSVALLAAGVYVFAQTRGNVSLMLCSILLVSKCCKSGKSSVEF